MSAGPTAVVPHRAPELLPGGYCTEGWVGVRTGVGRGVVVECPVLMGRKRACGIPRRRGGRRALSGGEGQPEGSEVAVAESPGAGERMVVLFDGGG